MTSQLSSPHKWHNPQREGIWLIDKPVGPSSFGMVSRLRRLTGIRKVGHAGTLDPLASGLLILLVGKDYTRQADQFLKLDKVYVVEATLGSTSSTGDGEGQLEVVSTTRPGTAAVRTVLEGFVGKSQQIPPAFSAIKVNGQRAYKLARGGKSVELAARPIEIYCLDQVEYQYPVVHFRVHVSSGTYIRSLVQDIGAQLDTGAYMSGLRRTRIGDYLINAAALLE